jgi:hypothetical protein
LLAITVFIIALYLGILAYLKRFEPVDMRHFNLPYDEAIRRLDALLTGRGIQHTESALDEHWFGKEKKRAGIDLDILDLKDGPATMFELNGGARWILVSEVLSDGVRETAISLWPMIGDHVQFFERLKSDIDAGLKAGPS